MLLAAAPACIRANTLLTDFATTAAGREPARAARNVMKRVGVFGEKVADFFETTVVLLQHFNNFERKPHCGADCLVCYQRIQRIGGLP